MEIRRWRVIDTGLRRAVENMAINQAMLAAHQEGSIPHTLRFVQFTPSALLGYHQSAEQELDIDYCYAQDVEIQRRITGGGAIYLDETQIGWELYLSKQTLGAADMQVIARKICEAAAQGISDLGVEAYFRPRNEIEVGGRKISGTGGAFEGESVLYQGSLLVDFDVERMLRVLRIPADKFSDRAITSARERVVNLKSLLGGVAPTMSQVKAAMTRAFASAFGVVFEEAIDLNEGEVDKFNAALKIMDTPEWIFRVQRPVSDLPISTSLYKCKGGFLRIAVAVDSDRRVIDQVWITGNVFVNPRRIIGDLEDALRNTPLSRIAERVRLFFNSYSADLLMLSPQDFITAIETAVASSPVEKMGSQIVGLPG